MPLLEAQVISGTADMTPADQSVNTLWYTIADGVFDPAVGYHNHAQELANVFSGHDATYPGAGVYYDRSVTVKVYDHADVSPRPIRAQVTVAGTGPLHGAADLSAPQQALVLSFYGTRNLKSQRGRIYIGPLQQSWANGHRPAAGVMTSLITLGHALFAVGGENVAHVVHSKVHNTQTVVQNYWVDDSWDVIRRRKTKATTRQKLTP